MEKKTTKQRVDRRGKAAGGELTDAELEQASGGVGAVAPSALSTAPATGAAAGAVPSREANALAELQRNMSEQSRMNEMLSNILKKEQETANTVSKNLKA